MEHDGEEARHGWKSSEMKDLLDQYLSNKSFATKKFNSRAQLKTFDWDTIKISGRSSEDCKIAFDKMTNYAYKMITVENVCDMVRAKLELKKVPMDMIPDAPKKPLTAFFYYSQKKTKSLFKKDPSLTLMKAQKMVANMWSSLSDAKKAKYSENYRERKAEYDKAVGVLSKSMKKHDRDGKLIPYDLYFWADETAPTSSKAAYNALGDKEKLQWIWKAIEECKKRKRACDENPNAGVPPTLHLKDSEKKLLLTSEGLYDKPDKTLLAYYCHRKGDVVSQDKNREYKAMSSSATKKLSQDYAKDLGEFISNLNSYLERRQGSMSEDEYQSYQLQLITCQKLLRKSTNKPTSKSSKKKNRVPNKDDSHDEDIDDKSGIQSMLSRSVNDVTVEKDDKTQKSRKRKVSLSSSSDSSDSDNSSEASSEHLTQSAKKKKKINK